MSKKQKNDKMAIAAVAETNLTHDRAEAKKMNPPAPKEELVSVASQIAGDGLFVRNWKFKNADKYFPYEPLMRRVDKCYPNAVGGQLLVDEPTTPQDVKDCIRKAAALKKEGIRYCYIDKDMDLDDARKQMAA